MKRHDDLDYKKFDRVATMVCVAAFLIAICCGVVM